MKIVEKAAKQILILCSLLIVLFVGFILSLVIHERMISHELLNAPFAQCGTAWESEDGIITMVVSDALAEEPLNYCDPVDGLTVYETETKVLYQGENHPAFLSIDYVPYLSTALSLAQKINLVCNQAAYNSIAAANGYGQIVSIYNRTTQASSSVLTGWYSHPWIYVNVNNPQNVNFTLFPQHNPFD